MGRSRTINELFTRFALLLCESETRFCGFADRVGKSERAPLRPDSTISDVNRGVAVLMKASSF